MLETNLTDLPDVKAPDLTFEHLNAVLTSLRPLQRHSFCVEAQKAQDVHKLNEGFLNMLNDNLSLEELVALYSASTCLFLLMRDMGYHQRLELLNGAFNYSDTLKPTMIHYATTEMIRTMKLFASNFEYRYVYLLETIPHILVASDTGKMISLSLLRAILSHLSDTDIILCIHRSLSEAGEMVRKLSVDTIIVSWSLRKTYVLVKTFSVVMATTAFNTCNQTLRLAGYRGFDLPEGSSAICEWFRDLRDRLEDKHKELNCKTGLMVVRFIDHNILSFLTETNESMSEAGTEAVSEVVSEVVSEEVSKVVSEAGNDITA